jgi:hypothetical protein
MPARIARVDRIALTARPRRQADIPAPMIRTSYISGDFAYRALLAFSTSFISGSRYRTVPASVASST